MFNWTFATVKKAIVSGEFARAIAYSTPDHRDKAIKMAGNKLQRNGYPQRWIKRESQRQQRNRHTTSSTKTKKKFNSVLHLPFITDSFNARAPSIIQLNGLDTVRIVNPQPMTIEQFTSKRQPQEKYSFRKPCWAKATSCFVYYVGSCTMSGVGLFNWAVAETAFFLGLSF